MVKRRMNWYLVFTTTFKKSYRNLSSDIKKNVDEAIRSIVESDKPELLGSRKIGKWKGVYTYEIGRKYRIFYTVNRKNNSIHFLYVGSHKIY